MQINQTVPLVDSLQIWGLFSAGADVVWYPQKTYNVKYSYKNK